MFAIVEALYPGLDGVRTAPLGLAFVRHETRPSLVWTSTFPAEMSGRARRRKVRPAHIILEWSNNWAKTRDFVLGSRGALNATRSFVGGSRATGEPGHQGGCVNKVMCINVSDA